MLTFRAIFIFSVVMSKIIAKRSVTSIRRSELDPNYALAYAERSEAWTIIGDLTGQRPTAYPKARSDAEKAVAIAPDLAEAHAALGWVRFFGEWKFAEGLSELKRAKELSPTNPTANDLLARVIVYLGRIDEAERQARQAVELDPLSVATQFNLARVLFYAGKLDEADAAGAKWQSCSRHLLPVIDGRCSSLFSAATARQLYAKRNWSLTTAFVRFELALAHYRTR